MPWGTQDVSRHNKTPQKKKWYSIANSILANSGDEDKAIRTANAAVKRRIERNRNG